jgi:glycosyltransferase involved in cell wall biosynthesis
VKILINAVSAKMGGAATYIRNLARELAELNQQNEFIFLVPEEQVQAINDLGSNIQVIATDIGHAPFWRRLWFDQVTLRRLIKREKANVLYSTANFGMFACPCHQVLLVRNSLYFSKAYLTYILPTQGMRARLENAVRRWLVCQSVKSADVVMTPSKAMLDELQQFKRVPADKVIVNHYGANLQLPNVDRRAIQARTNKEPNTYRLLYSSLYAEHKNLTTLFRALIHLTESRVDCLLITPADPNWEGARGNCIWRKDAELATDRRIINHIQFTGIMTGEEVTRLYGVSDLFVYPSLVESFGHPLIEAMASGLAIVASDTPINRELCADAAVYFSPSDAEECAEQIKQLLQNRALRFEMIERGLRRCKFFRWKSHVQKLLQAFDRTAVNYDFSAQEVI